jgi:phosphoserine phosphatase
MSIAFFDVDGTLVPLPSLETRFFWQLLRHRRIPPANCIRWAAGMLRLSDMKFAPIAQTNKMYLRGIPLAILAAPELQPGRWIPEFFPVAIQRICWHALRGDKIVLATGTLAPLAEIVKTALERELLWRGLETHFAVIATQLVTDNNRWTGGVEGTPICGEAKAEAVKNFARSRNVPLQECFAYGDHALDGWMLAAVGNPFAVNPTSRLRQIALHNAWQVMNWRPCTGRTAATRQALKWKGEAAP